MNGPGTRPLRVVRGLRVEGQPGIDVATAELTEGQDASGGTQL